MSTYDGPNGTAGRRGDREGEHEAERVVVRDRRRIDPLTGAVRVPEGGQPAPGSAVGSDTETETATEVGPEPIVEDDGEKAELAAQVAERTADLQRVTAEYANYRRRVDRDREGVLSGARAQFVVELLTVLDDIDRAQVHGDLNGPFKSVADKVVGVVTKLGLEPFGITGESFDPAYHEAVQHDRSDTAGPTVAVVSAVLRRGYRLADRVLRPAMVTVTDTDPPADPGDD